MKALDTLLDANKGQVKRVCVVTDGVFSMRGDHVPLHEITAICQQHEQDYEEGIITIVDDSHGVGALGRTGRGTEEYTHAQADILIATLGKALGVNGGYVVSTAPVIDYLRETAPLYIYSNPITPAEAAAAIRRAWALQGPALELNEEGRNLAAVDRIEPVVLRARFDIAIAAFDVAQAAGVDPQHAQSLKPNLRAPLTGSGPVRVAELLFPRLEERGLGHDLPCKRLLISRSHDQPARRKANPITTA
jgi:glycine C-acetyltransferase